MASPRIEALQHLLESHPNDPRAHFGLALEYERLEQWSEVVAHLQAYLSASDDEGNAHGRLARALLQLGRLPEARASFQAGIEAANRHGHPTMAAELEEELEEISQS
jgi:Flp pilus assembly protein TadD